MRLTKAAFTSALAKGLGRAYLHIQQQPFGDLAELRHACLYHQAYDPQCEEDRSTWLIQLIEATDNADDLYAEIFKLTQDLSFDDQVQRFAILGRLAQSAHPEAKAALYRHFNALGDDAQWLGTFEILAVDGLKGLASVAEALGKRLLADTTQWEDDTLLREAYARYSQAEVDAYLSKLTLSNPFIRAYVQAVQDNTERRREASLTQSLAQPLSDSIPLWQKKAAPETVVHFEDLLKRCNDPDDLHSAFFSIIRLCKAQYEPTYLPLLYRAYEEGPCSDCRLEVVKLLAHHKQLTPALLQECKFDAVADIRAIAHAYT